VRALLLLFVVGCAANAQVAAAPTPPPATAEPNVYLREPNAATVGSQRVPYAGPAESRDWPELARSLPGGAVAMRIDRTIPIVQVLRAVHAAQGSDITLQTLDEGGHLRSVALKARGSDQGCHLGAFLRPDGSFVIAAPGGARSIANLEQLTTLIDAERARCPFAYVAFGAETVDGSWGPLFDALVAVDRHKSAGDARYVLGELRRSAR
jgi:hypothetical protein